MTQTTLKDQWALILGASSGIGAAIAREFAQCGMNVIGVYLGRSQPRAETEKLVQELQSYGGAVKFIRANIANDEKRAEIIKTIKETLGEQNAIHAFVHSIAFGSLAPYLSGGATQAITRAQMEMTMDVMANSFLYWMQDLWQNKLLDRGSRAFSMSSAGSQQTVKNYGAVGAAKAALEAHTRQLAFELAPHGVAVNAIMAGVADTNALRKIPTNDEIVDSAMRRNPSKRLTTPQDVALAVRALSDPDLRWITGATIPVDGGEFFSM